MPMTAMRTGTSAEMGALTKILTHMPRIFPMFATSRHRRPERDANRQRECHAERKRS